MKTPTTLLYLSLSLACTLATAAPPAPPAKPNVLFIAVDDLKPLLGCYGDTVIKTPCIDKLATQSTTFLNAYCQQAVCAPSRASLLTGLRPDSTMVWDLKTLIRAKNPDVVTLPQYFKENGYETVGMGKVFDHRSVSPGKDDEISWSMPYLPSLSKAKAAQTLGFLEPAFVARVQETEKANRGDRKALIKSLGGTPTVEINMDVPDDAYEDGTLAALAVEQIGILAKAEKPFFLAVGFIRPHLPFVAPKKYAEMYSPGDIKLAEYQKMPEGAPEIGFQNSSELRNGTFAKYVNSDGLLPDDEQRELIHGYMACVSYTDAQIGKVLDALDASGEAENTIVVLWGDHGWHLGDHGMWCKHTNFEQATRAPLIIAQRAKGGKEGKSTSPVEFVDIYPTLCDLAGLPVPAVLQGKSLTPIMADPNAKVKDFAVSQYPRSPEMMGYSFRDERYRYTRWVPKNKTDEIKFEEMYDYQTDPLEKKSILNDPAAAGTARLMRSRADAFLAGGK